MRGYTIFELMVTVVIVTILAATVGIFFVKLLTLKEQDREEAYIRERLADICGVYADFISVGSSVDVHTNMINHPLTVTYRQEAGGVSLETGLVSRVSSVEASVNAFSGAVNMDVYGRDGTNNVLRLSRSINGNASLIPLAGDIVSCTIAPLGSDDGALRTLRVEARYQVRNDDGVLETRRASAERIVRLWNHK